MSHEAYLALVRGHWGHERRPKRKAMSSLRRLLRTSTPKLETPEGA